MPKKILVKIEVNPVFLNKGKGIRSVSKELSSK